MKKLFFYFFLIFSVFACKSKVDSCENMVKEFNNKIHVGMREEEIVRLLADNSLNFSFIDKSQLPDLLLSEIVLSKKGEFKGRYTAVYIEENRDKGVNMTFDISNKGLLMDYSFQVVRNQLKWHTNSGHQLRGVKLCLIDTKGESWV